MNRFFRLRLRWSAPLAGLILMPLASAQINGVLRPGGANPRYFTDDSGRAIYLTGAHTWANLVDGWLSHGVNNPSPPPFDFDGYLDCLQARHHNFIRLWTQHMTRTDFSEESGLPAGSKFYYASPSPWVRTGPGTALDGGAKFDLTQFNDAYFDRLRERVLAARARGMYVGTVLFEGYALRKKNAGLGWNYHPFHAANNVNGINGDPNGDGCGSEAHTLQAPGDRVWIADTDHIWGIGGSRDWVWKMFLRGYNPIYMDSWNNPDYPHTEREEVAVAMGQTRAFAQRINLAGMTPQNALASTGYALAAPGSQYLFYQPETGAFSPSR